LASLQTLPLRNGHYSKKLNKRSVNIAAVNQPIYHLSCVLYAMRTILRVLPALGSDKDHLHPPPGLSFKHFAVAGVICAVLLVSSLILLVTLLLGFIIPARAR
jgi:hypothetical protein